MDYDTELNWKRIVGYEEPNIHEGIIAIIQDDKKGVREVCKRYVSEINDKQREWGLRKRKYTIMQDVHRWYCDWRIEQLEKEKARYNRWILMASTSKQKERDGYITQEMIEHAKAYAIEVLLDFNGAGFAQCPWHSEKTASLKLYKKDNSVHCFGCGKHSDCIGVAMQIWGVDFKEAVKRLNK